MPVPEAGDVDTHRAGDQRQGHELAPALVQAIPDRHGGDETQVHDEEPQRRQHEEDGAAHPSVGTGMDERADGTHGGDDDDEHERGDEELLRPLGEETTPRPRPVAFTRPHE